MDNRMVFAIMIVLFIENVNHIASSQRINYPGVPCDTSADCGHHELPPGASCASGYCVCTDDRGVQSNCVTSRSQPRLPVHSPSAHVCKIEQDCEGLPHAYCNTTVNQCTCSHGFVMSTSSYDCLPISNSVGSSCKQDEQCSLPNSICRSGQCVCTAGYHYTENACWRTTAMNRSCKDSQECNHVVNAICNEESICSCAPRSVVSSDGKQCLSVARELMESCVDSIQCSTAYSGTECIEEKCRCRKNNHFARTELACVVSKHLGENCTWDWECYQDDQGEHRHAQRCLSGICACNENFIKHEHRCNLNPVSGASSLTPLVSVTALILLASLFSRQ